jgi:hypothetical protein
LLDVALRALLQVKIHSPKPINADERSREYRLRYFSLRQYDRVRYEGSAPRRFFGLMDFALGIFNGFPPHFCRDIKRSGKSANECAAAAEVTSAEFFKPPKALVCVLISATTNQLYGFQAKVLATAGNEGLDREFVRHKKSSFSLI